MTSEEKEREQGAALVVNSYRDLLVRQKAMDIAADCYRATIVFPKSESYRLSSQIRRAASSLPASIAEGHGRENTGSFVQFYRIAQGSLKELEKTHLPLAGSLISWIRRAETSCFQTQMKLEKC